MKKTISMLLVVFLLSGCARYQVSNLPSNNVMDYANRCEEDGVSVAAKTFEAGEIKQIFSGNTLEKGYQPVYLIIDNRSPNAYHFDKRSSLNMRSTLAIEVAKACGFNTTGRATAYGVGGFFTFGLLWIPAVVDGVGSANANQRMQSDYAYKEIKDGRIVANELRDGIVFVDRIKPGQILTVRLRNIETDEIALFEMELP